MRRQLEQVVVGHQPVAGTHDRDAPVAAIEDHVLAAPVTESRAALPPRQHGLPAVALHAEEGRRQRARHRVKPDDMPRVVDDHRAVLAGAALDGEEDVARGGAAARRDRHAHAVGREVRARVEAQDIGGGRGRGGGGIPAGARAAAAAGRGHHEQQHRDRTDPHQWRHRRSSHLLGRSGSGSDASTDVR